MGLTLTTLRCPNAASPESRHAAGGEFTIGRGRDNDWVLPDPERHLSKQHCILAYRAGQWQVSDVSSNGTFLNRETSPLGKGKAPRSVRSGDRIRFGSYEIELTVEEDEAAPAMSQRGGSGARRDQGLTPAMLDPFAEQPKPTPLLPVDFDPQGAEDGPFHPTQSDHAPAIEDAFRPPPPIAAAIPDDWDVDLPASPSPAASVPTPARPSAMLPAGDFLTPLPPTPVPAQPPASQRVTVATPPAPAAPQPPDSALLAAFLRGTGLADAVPPDPERTMEAVGAALREAVAGIRQTLIARASIKGEFRIEQTMVRASGNNPLKFSAGDDDALAALLGLGRRNAMPADQAMAEALRDMRLHELATVAAMQTAVRALLAQFDPDGIERAIGSAALDKLPGQRKARAWDAFAAMHDKATRALSDDFDSIFGKAFARAYELAMHDAAAGRETL